MCSFRWVVCMPKCLFVAYEMSSNTLTNFKCCKSSQPNGCCMRSGGRSCARVSSGVIPDTVKLTSMKGRDSIE